MLLLPAGYKDITLKEVMSDPRPFNILRFRSIGDPAVPWTRRFVIPSTRFLFGELVTFIHLINSVPLISFLQDPSENHWFQVPGSIQLDLVFGDFATFQLLPDADAQPYWRLLASSGSTPS